MSLCNISAAFTNEGAALSLSRKHMNPGEQLSGFLKQMKKTRL